jgi:hypothetical protein
MPFALSAMLFVAGAALLYGPALGVGLLSDDFMLLERARTGVLIDPAWSFVRPVPLAIWALVDTSLPDTIVPTALHMLNIGLHGLNAAIVGGLAGEFGCEMRVSRAASVVFLVFPASVEAVTWSSGVFDVLLCTLILATAYLIIRSDRLTPRHTVLAVVFSLAALGTKETAVAMPVLLAVATFMKFGTRWVDGYRSVLWCGAVVAGYVIWRAATGLEVRSFPPLSGYSAKELITRPFAALAMPYHQQVVQALAMPVALSVAVLPVVVALRVSLSRVLQLDSTLLLGTTVWVLAAAAPVFTVLFVGSDLQGARYVYVSSAVWAVLLASNVSIGHRIWLRRAAAVIGALWLVLLIVAVRMHMIPWIEAAHVRDEIIDVVRFRAQGCRTIAVDRPRDNVGGAYVFRNGFPEALRHHGIRARVRQTEAGEEPSCRVALPKELSEPDTSS